TKPDALAAGGNQRNGCAAAVELEGRLRAAAEPEHADTSVVAQGGTARVRHDQGLRRLGRARLPPSRGQKNALVIPQRWLDREQAVLRKHEPAPLGGRRDGAQQLGGGFEARPRP